MKIILLTVLATVLSSVTQAQEMEKSWIFNSSEKSGLSYEASACIDDFYKYSKYVMKPIDEKYAALSDEAAKKELHTNVVIPATSAWMELRTSCGLTIKDTASDSAMLTKFYSLRKKLSPSVSEVGLWYNKKTDNIEIEFNGYYNATQKKMTYGYCDEKMGAKPMAFSFKLDLKSGKTSGVSEEYKNKFGSVGCRE